MKTASLKKVGLAFLLAGVLALCAVLTGCSGGGSSSDYSANFQGDYKLTALDDGTTSYDEEYLAELESYGFECSLALAEDKTASLTLLGESMDGTWEAKSATECTISFDDEGDVTATLDGDTLKMEEDGQSLVFTKNES